MQYVRGILGVELRADVPALVRYLYYLDEVCGGVDTHALHTRLFVFVKVGVIELIAVAVSFLNQRHLAIGLVSTAVFCQFALVGTQSHGAAHLGDALLLLHDVDDVGWSFG